MKDDHASDPVACEGGLFDPVMKAEHALANHAWEEHGDNPITSCSTCLVLSRELATLALKYQGTYRHSGGGACRFCQAELLWFTTPNKRQMPIDRERLLEAWPALQRPNALRGLWTTKARGKERILPFSHWATCPKADQARKEAP